MLNSACKKRSTLVSDIEKKHNKNNNNIVIEDWLLERLADKLMKASIIVHNRHMTHLLYRNTIEEKEDALQEEVGLLTEKYVLVITYDYGGLYPL